MAEVKIEKETPTVPDCFGVLFDDSEECRNCKLYENCKTAAVEEKIEETAAVKETALVEVPVEKTETPVVEAKTPDKADIEDPDSGLVPAKTSTRKKPIMLDVAFFKIEGGKSTLVDKEKDATLVLRKGDKVRVNNKRSKFHGKEGVFNRYSVNWNECPVDLGGKFKANIKPHHLEIAVSK